MYIAFKYLATITITFFLTGAAYMFLRGKDNKARRMLAWELLLWGLLCFISVHFFADKPYDYPIFSFPVLLYGLFFVQLLFLFPLEVVLPGWLNKRRTFYLFLGPLILTSVYFAVVLAGGMEIRDYCTFRELFSEFGKFTVWYRMLFYIYMCVITYILLLLVSRYELKYEKWRNENYSDHEQMDISWMKYYLLGVILIVISYHLLLLVGSDIAILLHILVVLGSSMLLFYKGLFYESPYPADFYERGLDVQEEAETRNQSFEAQMPVFIDRFRQWMEEEKPYLHQDFKLSDLTRILPLNRSYISRLFNEGMQKNFSEVVRSYRVEYAKNILLLDEEISIYKVAELSGFSSDSTFIRSFVKETGMTPKQFRNLSRK